MPIGLLFGVLAGCENSWGAKTYVFRILCIAEGQFIGPPIGYGSEFNDSLSTVYFDEND